MLLWEKQFLLCVCLYLVGVLISIFTYGIVNGIRDDEIIMPEDIAFRSILWPVNVVFAIGQIVFFFFLGLLWCGEVVGTMLKKLKGAKDES